MSWPLAQFKGHSKGRRPRLSLSLSLEHMLRIIWLLALQGTRVNNCICRRRRCNPNFNCRTCFPFFTCLSCLTYLVLSYHHFSIYQVVVCGRSVVWLFLAHQIFMFLYRGHLTIQYLTHEEKRESANIWLINWFRHISQFRKFELCQVWQIRIDGLMTGWEVSQLVTMVKMLTLGFLIPKNIKSLLPHRVTCLSRCCFQSDERVGAVGLVNINCDVFRSAGQVRVTQCEVSYFSKVF